MASGAKTLALVDDEAPVLQVLERWTRDAGYAVTAFDRFETARSYLTHHPTDVIVTDIRLGAFNGLQLVLLAKSLNPAVIAIVVSGFDDPVLRAEAERAGARYFVKPPDRDDFLAALQRRAE